MTKKKRRVIRGLVGVPMPKTPRTVVVRLVTRCGCTRSFNWLPSETWVRPDTISIPMMGGKCSFIDEKTSIGTVPWSLMEFRRFTRAYVDDQGVYVYNEEERS